METRGEEVREGGERVELDEEEEDTVAQYNLIRVFPC